MTEILRITRCRGASLCTTSDSRRGPAARVGLSPNGSLDPPSLQRAAPGFSTAGSHMDRVPDA
eukprot:1690038-Pleurochrysis_carterae.AAC.1